MELTGKVPIFADLKGLAPAADSIHAGNASGLVLLVRNVLLPLLTSLLSSAPHARSIHNGTTDPGRLPRERSYLASPLLVPGSVACLPFRLQRRPHFLAVRHNFRLQRNHRSLP
ncbi:hypothetical protein FIBSPDRAFT_599459 [Athelia psychrophila]|uniref:Uncharacterized protein n=1 Tax=Athelia psychrophila TaxID=1759441 RepID=A0A166GS47_9AGAM|nr:hypothetical protein FIBSPDRAFT_599459 [Fibularhizoctonia sp. CBS 109695]